MEFFLAVSALLLVSATYLIHQYRSRAFVSDEPADAMLEQDPAAESLKAA